MPGSLMRVTRLTFAVDESNSALSMPTAHVLHRPSNDEKHVLSAGGKGGDGGDWGKDGQPTVPLDGVPQDAGKGGAAICGLNPDTGAKNWVIGGTISDNTLKGKYTGDCIGGGAPIPPVPSPATVTVSKPHYVRFGDDAGNGTDGYGADGAANLLVTAPPDSSDGNICNFRIRYTWNDREGLGVHMSGMEVAGRIFRLAKNTLALIILFGLIW